jgi:hypothetical protein
MDVAHTNTFGKGKAVLMNLSPQWYNAYRTAGEEPARHRETFLNHLKVHPTVKLTGDGAFGHEITRWQKDGRTYLFVTLNPEITGSETGGGNSAGLKSATIPVTLEFATPIKSPRDERAGKRLPDGKTFKFDWKMNEAIVISYESAD